ncbi:MAG: thioredoxin family protein [Verrucomicrobiota bacterium]
MKTIFLSAAILMSLIASAFTQEAEWNTDYAKAVEQAKAESKPILLDFTGSDWCGWCMKMKKETLDTPMFNHYAAKNLVLMEVDFPHNKPQTDEVKKQNQQLSQKYKVDGFPCFVLVDKIGKELGRQGGYLEGGPTAFIAKLNTFHKPKPAAAAPAAGSDFDKLFKKPAQAANP